MSITTFTDNSIMPFGLHRGKKLIDVPAEYLIFMSSNSGWNKLSSLGRYVTANIDVLKSQVRNSKQQRR